VLIFFRGKGYFSKLSYPEWPWHPFSIRSNRSNTGQRVKMTAHLLPLPKSEVHENSIFQFYICLQRQLRLRMNGQNTEVDDKQNYLEVILE
jgi:hypothetical protein